MLRSFTQLACEPGAHSKNMAARGSHGIAQHHPVLLPQGLNAVAGP